jgi:hypothetical protein
VRGFFTSDNRDEVGDIITRSATERALPLYRRWGNIRRMHLPEPVGKVTKIGSDDGLEWNEVEIKVIDPRAVFEVENGLLQALSVGILIKWEDIDMLEDGGWIINDYRLAEISLVDHPANYDAALELSMDDSLRSEIREKGLVPVLRSLGLTGEKPMPEDKDLEVTEAVEEVVAPVETEEVKDEPVAEPVTEPVAESEEKAIEEEEIVEPVADPVVEETVEASLEAEPVVEDVAEKAVGSVVDAVKSETETMLKIFADAVLALTKAVEAVSPKQETKGVAAEDPAAKDQSERERILEEEVAELKRQLAELSAPANRNGSVPEEKAVPESENVTEEEQPASLRDAVSKFLRK